MDGTVEGQQDDGTGQGMMDWTQLSLGKTDGSTSRLSYSATVFA